MVNSVYFIYSGYSLSYLVWNNGMKYSIRINYLDLTKRAHVLTTAIFNRDEVIAWFSEYLETKPKLKDKIKNFEVIESYD